MKEKKELGKREEEERECRGKGREKRSGRVKGLMMMLVMVVMMGCNNGGVAGGEGAAGGDGSGLSGAMMEVGRSAERAFMHL